MTNEKAIQMLQAHKFPNPTEAWQMLNNEAIDMAIESLSADAVSREDGIPCPICNGKGIIKRSLDVNANVVEVVRCKDCRHAEHRCQMENQVYCFRDKLCPHGYLRDDDDFCKYGERRKPCD